MLPLGIRFLLLLLLLLLVSGFDIHSSESDEEDDSDSDITMMIHLIPHSHVDAGYLETSESIFESSVNTILHKVLDQLDNDVNRRFVWAETFFFRQWYESLNQGDKERARRAVLDGQLEFVGGGVVEHDESLSTWESVVEQLSLGHDWLERHFGESARPKVAWQVDSAGHSDATPKILSMMGYEGLIMNRVHYRLKQQFRAQKHLEFVWRGTETKNLQKGDDIFTHVMYEGYNTLEGYDFESSKGVRQVTNAKRRADRLVHTLRKWVAAYKTHHLLVPFGDNLRFLEADKQFTNMEKLMRYINEKIPDVRIRFSTATEYIHSVRETAAVTGLEFPRYVGDFLPYADNKDSYWSGMFSSRQSFKEACRDVESLVRSADVFYALARARSTTFGDAPRMKAVMNGFIEVDKKEQPPMWDVNLFSHLEKARITAAHMTHHHAITGTSRVQVVNHYLEKIQDAESSANTVLEAALSQLLTKREGTEGQKVRPHLTPLPFNLNTDTQPAGEVGTSGGTQHPILVYNSDGVRRLKMVQIFVGTEWNSLRHAQVVNAKGESVRAQLHNHLIGKKGKGKDKWSTKVYLSFLADVPPLGYTTFFCYTTSARERIKRSHLVNVATPVTKALTSSAEAGATKKTSGQKSQQGLRNKRERLQQDKPGASGARVDDSNNPLNGLEYVARDTKMIKLDNDLLQVQVDGTTGMLHSILDKRTKRSTLLRQQFLNYPGPKSGVYLFRPDKPQKVIFDKDSIMVAVTKGPVFEQVQVFGNNGIGQVIRLWKADDKRAKKNDAEDMYSPVTDVQGYVEVNHVVAPEVGMDTVVRYETSMDTDGVFYTDNSFGKLIKRITHRDAPTASNVFPAVSTAALRDNLATSVTRMGQVLTISSKTPFAVSSPFTENGAGSLELMLHRNHENDDSRGLGEPLTDFTVSQFTTLLAVGTPNVVVGNRLAHLVNRVQRPCEPFFALENADFVQIMTRENWASRFNVEDSFVASNSSDMLLSIKARDASSDQVLVRFHNGDHHSRRSVNVNKLFDASHKVTGLHPCTLSGGPSLGARFGIAFKTSPASSSSSSFEHLSVGGGFSSLEDKSTTTTQKGSTTSLTLEPDEIKTVVLNLVRLDHNEQQISMYSKNKKQEKGRRKKARKNPSISNTPEVQGATKVERGEEDDRNGDVEKDADSEPEDSEGANVKLASKEELEERVEEHKTHIEAMQRRVDMYKSNIDQLLAEIDKFDKQGKKHLKDATIQDLKNAETSLSQAQASVESSRKELAIVLAQLKTLDKSYKIEGADVLFGDEVRIREAEATIHGAVAGAAAMLLFVLAGNWIFSGGLKLVRGYVPISFGFTGNKNELPTHKVN